MNTIGVIIPWINRPFISSLISGIEIGAKKAGYNVLISQSHDSLETEIKNAQALYSSRVAAVIASLAIETTTYDHFRQFMKGNIPVVFVDRTTDELNSDQVIIDNFEAGFKATEHLIHQGCKRIAHFAGSQNRNVYQERKRGYIEALRKHGLSIDERLIVYGQNLSMEEGTRSMKYICELPDLPEGIFSANDSAAVSAIQYAKQVGLKIPDDIAIIGFNDDPICTIIDPCLSSVTHPAIDLGKIAVKQVLKTSDDNTIIKSEKIILKTDLIIRKSSSRLP